MERVLGKIEKTNREGELEIVYLLIQNMFMLLLLYATHYYLSRSVGGAREDREQKTDYGQDNFR
jgi:hypothetical protein